MTSYELLDFYERILLKMEELDVYTKNLTQIINSSNQLRDTLLNKLYTSGINASSNVLNEYNVQRENILKIISEFSMNFDLLGNQQKLIRVRSEIDKIFKDINFDVNDEKQKIYNILDQYYTVTSTIYEYVRSRNSTIIVDLLNKASNIVNEYEKFVESYKNVKDFMSKTENKLVAKESEKTFKLYFYDEHINIEEYISNFTSINEIYEIMCQIFNISSSEYQLRIVKIESGSLFENFLGEDSVVEAISFLFKKIVELVFNKFTFEGKVLRHKQILDLMKEDAEVIGKYKELGLEINFDNEGVDKLHYQLIKSMGNLVGQTTRVKINDEEFSLEDNLKQKYLSESNVLRIDEPKNENELEEI